jgi:hypothetical protein
MLNQPTFNRAYAQATAEKSNARAKKVSAGVYELNGYTIRKGMKNMFGEPWHVYKASTRQYSAYTLGEAKAFCE